MRPRNASTRRVHPEDDTKLQHVRDRSDQETVEMTRVEIVGNSDHGADRCQTCGSGMFYTEKLKC